MEEIYSIQISNKRSGFTNQLLAFITGLDYAKRVNKNIVVVDNMLTDFEKDEYIPFSHVVDLVHLNKILKDKNFNITVFDKNYFNIKLKSITYGNDGNDGNDDNIIDITEETKTNFYSNNILRIPKNIDLNDIKYDPDVGKMKKIFINYTINEKLITILYAEKRLTDIILNFNKKFDFKYTFGGVTAWNKKNIDYILSNLLYVNGCNAIAKKVIDEIPLKNKINVIHLRVEDDAIKHWSKMNKLSYDEFKEQICNKYIKLIIKYFDKDNHIIVLTYNIDNPVIKYMYDNGYKYSFVNKQNKMGRELNAAIDINVSRACNGTFIGCANIENNSGSTFSFYVHLLAKKNNAKTVMFDIDHINEPEKVY